MSHTTSPQRPMKGEIMFSAGRKEICHLLWRWEPRSPCLWSCLLDDTRSVPQVSREAEGLGGQRGGHFRSSTPPGRADTFRGSPAPLRKAQGGPPPGTFACGGSVSGEPWPSRPAPGSVRVLMTTVFPSPLWTRVADTGRTENVA